MKDKKVGVPLLKINQKLKEKFNTQFLSLVEEREASFVEEGEDVRFKKKT